MSSKLLNVDVSLSVMEWETSLLGRTLGRVEGLDTITDMIRGAEALKQVEQQAIASGIELIVSRVTMDHFTAVWTLEASGFSLVDVGVTFEYDFSKGVTSLPNHAPDGLIIRQATIDDLPSLQEVVNGLFVNSYYYIGPFFSTAEADLLHRAWIANCVRKERADQVLLAEISGRMAGFVTCRSLPQRVGVIDLIGVLPSHGSRGVGKSLVKAALDCFRELGVARVRVRTQVTNRAAVNVYAATGARLIRVDATLIKSLAG